MRRRIRLYLLLALLLTLLPVRTGGARAMMNGPILPVENLARLSGWPGTGQFLDVRALIYSPVDGRLYASIFDANAVGVYNPASGAQIRIDVGQGPSEMQLDRNDGRIFVLNQNAGTLSVLLPGATAAQEIRLDGVQIRAFGLDATLNRLYLRGGVNQLLALDATTFQALQTVTLPDKVNSMPIYTPMKIAVSEALHRVYVGLNYGALVYDGQNLQQLDDLAGDGRTMAVTPDGQNMYQTHYCDAKTCGIRTYLVDLASNQQIASLPDVSGVLAFNGNHAYGIGVNQNNASTLSNGRLHILDLQSFAWVDTGIDTALVAPVPGSEQLYAISLKNGSIIRISDNMGLSNAANAQNLYAKIEILWPHDDAGNQAPTQTATRANLMATIFQPGGYVSVACDWDRPVYLWGSRNNEPAFLIGIGVRRLYEVKDYSMNPPQVVRRYPIWEFNDVDVRWANNPENKLLFWLTVDGASVNTSIWSHAIDPLTNLPHPLIPATVATSVPDKVDARIDIVWPHNQAGQHVGVTDADYANIGVSLYQAGTQISVGSNWDSPVRLYSVLNNGPAQLVGEGKLRMASQNGLSYPVWDFNDVDVRPARDPLNKYYFYVLTPGLTYPTIWVHGADGRTLLPNPDTVYGGCR